MTSEKIKALKEALREALENSTIPVWCIYDMYDEAIRSENDYKNT